MFFYWYDYGWTVGREEGGRTGEWKDRKEVGRKDGKFCTTICLEVTTGDTKISRGSRSCG